MLFIMGILLSLGAMAQNKDVKNDQKVLKNTIVDKKADKHEAGKNLAHLRIKKALRGRREVRRHRRSIHRQGEHLESHGVKHPIHKAREQAKLEKERKEN